MWVALTIGELLNALRLRARIAALQVLADQPAAGHAQPPDVVAVTGAGVRLDRATRSAAARALADSDLEVLDLVPGDLAVEQALDLVRWVDPAHHRTKLLQVGRTAGSATVATPAAAARAELTDADDLDQVTHLRAAGALKRAAPDAYEFAVAPGLRSAPPDPALRQAYVRTLAGRPWPFVAGGPVAHAALVAAGAAASPGWAAAALATHVVQPWLIFAGTPIEPVDLHPGPAVTRLWRNAHHGWAALRGGAEPAVPVPGGRASIDALRPTYDALLAGGVERFLEPRRPDCPMCGSAQLRGLVRVPDLIQYKPGRFTLDTCTDCGHVFQNPRLTPEGLDFYYRDFYDGLGEDELDGAFAGGEAAYRKRASAVPSEVKPARWLDVGGGHGHFALVARQQWPATEFHVVDQADSVVEAERRGWVAHGYRGTLAELAASDPAPYDIVSMYHYLEHSREPRDELDAATHLLAPGGHLAIECPDPESRWGRLVRGAWGPWLQPQHQHFLTVAAVQDELAARGYDIVAVERASAHQMGDVTGTLWTALQWLAPAPDRPWLPRRTPAQRVARVAVLAAAGPLLLAGVAVDLALSPVWPRLPGGPNAYRVLAVRR